MERQMPRVSRFQSLSILALVLIGGFGLLIVFDVDVETDIIDPLNQSVLPYTVEDQVIEIDTHIQEMIQLESGAYTPGDPAFLPFYHAFTEGIAVESNNPIWIFNTPGDNLSGGTYILFHEVVVSQDDLETYFQVNDLDLLNGSKKILYSHDPFSTSDKYNFLVYIEGTWYLTQRGTLVYSTFTLERVLSNLVIQSNDVATTSPI